MKEFRIRILEADNAVYQGPCESLIVPVVDGQYGILAGHSNMISAVIPGMLTYRVPGGEKQILAVSAGLVKVEDNDVLVLVDSAERPEEIDVNRAKREADEAREAMLHKRSILEYRTAQAKLTRAVNRLHVREDMRD